MSIEAMKKAKEVMANARDWFGNDPEHRWDEDGVYHELVDAVVDLNKAIAEAEKQEPVAWMYDWTTSEGEFIQNWTTSEAETLRDTEPTIISNVRPLYTHPPKRKWVGLTDEEVVNLVDDEDWYNYPEGFVKIVEAKLKEKNT